MKLQKCMRYEIIKPINCEWKLFGTILKELQCENSKALNKTIQLCWEYSNFSSDYKEKYKVYPSKKEVFLPEYKSISGYIYNKIKDICVKSNSCNISQTLQKALDKWNNDQKQVFKGEKSISNFKQDSPIIIHNNSIRIKKSSNGYYFNLGLVSNAYKKELNLTNGSFDILVHAREKTKKDILDRILSGEYKNGAAQIVHKKNKWYIILSYQFDSFERKIDINNVMGIDLGIVNAAYIAFNNNLKRYSIVGSEIEEYRRKIEKRRIELLNQSKYCGDGRIGHGMARRIQPTEKISEKISNFRDTINHKYSRYIVDLAVKHECGVIQMENLSGIGKLSKFLKNWSYFDLQTKIENKAKEFGIIVKYIKPKCTSQRCNECGHISPENRTEQATFICQKCGYKTNADFNAARNIAIPDIDMIIEAALFQRESQVDNELK